MGDWTIPRVILGIALVLGGVHLVRKAITGVR